MKRREFLQGVGIGTVGALGAVLGGCAFKNPLAEEDDDREKAGQVSAEFDGTVEYRMLPRSGMKLSTISLGAGSLHESSLESITDIIAYAADKGVNFLDTVMADFTAARAIAAGMQGRRDKIVTQMHIGVCYPGGTYTRTRDMSKVKEGFEQQLRGFGTDYSDIGMIHYVDTEDDFAACVDNGLLDYAQELKQEGTIRAIGFSSHSVEISRKFLATGLIDTFMFSLNPAYDFTPDSSGNLVLAADRKALYEEAVRCGAGITVMKAYAGGRLLTETGSPFGKALSTTQCIQYALDRPAVVSCPIGVRNMSDLGAALAYYEAGRGERDYSALLAAGKQAMEGVCIYCDHCLPCPYGIDIGMVSKYYDLAKSGDEVARHHYMELGRAAEDCAHCGECEQRCPFQVKIRERMDEIDSYFGR
jgi:predicted aldo/keto reductase-like oxidoreductase